ncbi:rubrerythrin family protein [Candidatus Woesearchaeota archaeon]|nr:MAG: rubrerythrin family protein [Candidatus Woesearchaeota archaeon]
MPEAKRVRSNAPKENDHKKATRPRKKNKNNTSSEQEAKTQAEPELATILQAQRSELTEHHIYQRLAAFEANKHNKNILERIANDELHHYRFWKSVSKQDVTPNKAKILLYTTMAKVLGLTFTLRLMEYGEDASIKGYRRLKKHIPGVSQILKDEQRHEHELISLLKEEKLHYASSIVLGLNDALVELSGALAGLTFALANGKLIAVTGLIMGFAASLSMAASGYLSSREEEQERGGKEEKKPLTSAFYTGIAYLLTVIVLIAPYFIFKNPLVSLAVMLAAVLCIIAFYTFYISTAKQLPFKRRFAEMALISLGVALITYGVGWVLRTTIGVDI